MYYYNNELPPQQGWICPKCGRVNAPWLPTCGCTSSQTSGTPYLVKTSSISQDSHEIAKDEPQTNCGDFADRLAYERGVKHAWEVAQKVFTSTVTFYEAEDVAKQIDKDINVRSKTEPQTEHRDCINCESADDCAKCRGFTDEPQTYITEDRDTQILDAWQVHHRSTTSVEERSE